MSMQRQSLPALVMRSRKCQWGWTRVCFQCCLRPSSLAGSQIPIVCGGVLLPAHWILSGIWVVTWGGHLLEAGRGQRAKSMELSHRWQCWQCSGGWMWNVLSKSGIQVTPAKRNKPTVFCWCRWLRGQKRFWGAGSPSASIQFLFLLTMQYRALNFCFSVEMERSTVLTQSLGTEPSPSVPDLQQVRTPICCYGLNLSFRLFLSISHPSSFLLVTRQNFPINTPFWIVVFFLAALSSSPACHSAVTLHDAPFSWIV